MPKNPDGDVIYSSHFQSLVDAGKTNVDSFRTCSDYPSNSTVIVGYSLPVKGFNLLNNGNNDVNIVINSITYHLLAGMSLTIEDSLNGISQIKIVGYLGMDIISVGYR